MSETGCVTLNYVSIGISVSPNLQRPKNLSFTCNVGDVSVANIIVTNIVSDISFLYDREVQWSLNDRHLEQVKPVRS